MKKMAVLGMLFLASQSFSQQLELHPDYIARFDKSKCKDYLYHHHQLCKEEAKAREEEWKKWNTSPQWRIEDTPEYKARQEYLSQYPGCEYYNCTGKRSRRR